MLLLLAPVRWSVLTDLQAQPVDMQLLAAGCSP